MQNVSPRSAPTASAAAPPRARSIGFLALSALVVFAAGLSLYLELKIRSTAADLERLRAQRRSPTAVSPERTARDARPNPAGENPAAPNSATAPRRSGDWAPDGALLEQQWKQAVAAMGPDLALIRGAKNQLRVRLRFQELYRILGLSEAEIVAFENEASDKNLTFNPLVSSDPASVNAHARSQANAMDRIVETTLGPDYIEPFRMFLATSDLRDLTADLAAVSLGAGETLSAEQAAALLQTSLDSRRSTNGATLIGLDQIDWDAVAAGSQKFLTPAQQKLLRAMIDRRNFHRKFQDITGLPMHRPIRGLRP